MKIYTIVMNTWYQQIISTNITSEKSVILMISPPFPQKQRVKMSSGP